MMSSGVKGNISKLKIFRKNIGVDTPDYIIQKFWESKKKSQKEDDRFDDEIVKNKYEIVEQNLHKLLIFDWVKFISITGSVAAGNVKEDDDIDVFIVVKNDRMWLYRFFLIFKLGFNSVRRVWGKPAKDKIDTNFICEERGILFNSKNIFTLHELIFMIPVYNKDYHEYLLSINADLLKDFGIEKKKANLNKKRYIFLKPLNSIAFHIQLLYMFLMRHKPDLNRMYKNNKLGRIEFFPKDFQSEKLKEYNKKIGD